MRISLKRLALLAVIVTSCVGCDQASKAAARGFLASSPAISFLGDLFRLQYVENPGAFLGLGSTLPEHWRLALMTVGTSAWLLILFVALLKYEFEMTRFVGLSLMLAGGAGNLIDRIFNHNTVVDFMNLGIGHVRTGIFNVADIALMCGVALVLSSAVDPSPGQKEVR